MKIETLLAGQVSDADLDRLTALFCAVYPDPARDLRAFHEATRQRWQRYAGAEELRPRRFIVRDASGDAVIAKASLLPRRIRTSRGEELIAGLGDVTTHPDHRNCSLGVAVVRAVFDLIDRGDYAFCLFQTANARLFYEKLGCHVVENRIVNSIDPTAPTANPFRDQWVMSYLAPGRTMPAGEIDLLGPGY